MLGCTFRTADDPSFNLYPRFGRRTLHIFGRGQRIWLYCKVLHCLSIAALRRGGGLLRCIVVT
eukprot:1708864-Pyramimonas_sp.AAC.1